MYKNISIISLFLYASVCHAEGNSKLIGIWGMEPLQKSGKAIANVVEYRTDGTYQQHGFHCDNKGGYVASMDENSKGDWSIANGILTLTVTDPDELKQYEELVTPLREDMKTMSDQEKKMMRGILGDQIMSIVEGNTPKTEETLLAIGDGVMETEQKINGIQTVKIVSRKIKEIKPLCD